MRGFIFLFQTVGRAFDKNGVEEKCIEGFAGEG
jgi:hypothetical protein